MIFDLQERLFSLLGPVPVKHWVLLFFPVEHLGALGTALQSLSHPLTPDTTCDNRAASHLSNHNEIGANSAAWTMSRAGTERAGEGIMCVFRSFSWLQQPM